MKIDKLTLTASCELDGATITVTRTKNGTPPTVSLQSGDEPTIEAVLFFGEPLERFTEAQSRVAFALSDSLSTAQQSVANSATFYKEIDRARERRASERPTA